MRKTSGWMWCVNSAAAMAVAAAALAWRSRVMPRRDPRLPYRDFELTSADGTRIAVRQMPGAGGAALIVAHPAVTGQRYAPVVGFAEMATDCFDVFTFDFRGHGRSGGCLDMNLIGPVEDLRAVVREVRSRGYEWVGAVGFSLGGMAAFMLAALYGGLDAVVTVSAPPRLPDLAPYRRVMPLWTLFLLFLGARFRAVNEGGPVPMLVAADFPDIPLLVVHAEKEAFYERSDLDIMLGTLGNKAEFMLVEGAGHTELAGREGEILGWLAERRRAGGRA